MSRLASNDFKQLLRFAKEYKIPPLTSPPPTETATRRAHKQCLGMVQVFIRLDEELSDYTSSPLLRSPQSVEQLAESRSDLMAARFCSLHGLHKPAAMSLRSSVETFVRGIAGAESEECGRTTSMFVLMREARRVSSLQGPSAVPFAALHNLYKELCGIAHSDSQRVLLRRSISDFPQLRHEHAATFAAWSAQYAGAASAILVNAYPTVVTKANGQVR